MYLGDGFWLQNSSSSGALGGLGGGLLMSLALPMLPDLIFCTNDFI
jgi:hypothetical protein